MSFNGTARSVARIVKAIEQSEGAGARVRRSIGSSNLRNLSPFLMLDHFNVPSGAGFPDHAHRGQETVTYMLEGAFQHEDFAGHAGTIEAGDLQWMSAGRGIMHSEMPLEIPGGKTANGLQLWVDLPSRYKMSEPRYQELKDVAIPRANVDDKVTVKVISGESFGVTSPVKTYVGVWYLDITLKPGGVLKQPIPNGWNAFLYTIQGDVLVSGEQKVGQFNTVVLSREGDGLHVANEGSEEARLVMIAGEPLDGQPCIQYGPFVMDSREGIQQAFMDYQNQENGFERAKGWQSKIAAHMM